MAADALGFAQTATLGGAVVKTYYLPLNKLDATAAPGVGNDGTQGYVAGSLWVDRTHHAVYVCASNATGAAVWEAVAGGGTDGNDLTLVYSNTSVAAGDTVTGSGGGGAFAESYTLPANTLRAGDVIRVTARGVYSTNSGLATFRVQLQSSVFGSLLDSQASGFVFAPASGVSDRGWVCEALIVVQAVGSGGSAAEPVECQGECRFAGAIASGSYTAAVLDMTHTTPVALNLTVGQDLFLSATIGSGGSGDKMTLRQFVVEHGAAT